MISTLTLVLIAPPRAWEYAWAELPINFEFLMTTLGVVKLLLFAISAPPSLDPFVTVVSTLLFLKVVPLISIFPYDSIAPPP